MVQIPAGFIEGESEGVRLLRSDTRDALDGRLTRGNPKVKANHPNGALDNWRGSWVSVEVDTLDAAVTCTHNLGVEIVGSNPNVLWQIVSVEHDGAGASATSGATDAQFETGDTITTNTIELRFYSPGRTVDGTHPLTVILWFEPTEG